MPDHGRKKGFYLRQRREMMGQIEEQLKEEKALGNNCRAVGTRRPCLKPRTKASTSVPVIKLIRRIAILDPKTLVKVESAVRMWLGL